MAYNRYLLGESVDNMQELSYHDRKRVHNLKYYTWVEQQGRSYEEIQAQWYDDDYWTGIPANGDRIDALIDQFNERVGLLELKIATRCSWPVSDRAALQFIHRGASTVAGPERSCCNTHRNLSKGFLEVIARVAEAI